MRDVRIVIIAACIVATSACSSSPANSAAIGELRYEDGAAHITVPALWAGVNQAGEQVGGIEAAEIAVSTSSATPEYSVDLTDVAAKGAGSAWRAATSMAAAFATAYAGAEPAAVDVSFAVTGPIDGPSAGGLLTVGLLAAYQGQSLLPGATMTGTITADGSIGPVGGVPTKIRSAAREGYRTVVVPADSSAGSWEDGNSLTDLAASVGVTLVPVRTIGDAYAAMTGAAVEAPDLSPGPPLSAATRAVTEAGTVEVLTRVAASIAESGPALDTELLTWASDSLASARTDFDAGRTARAYGTGVLTLTQLTRATAAAETSTLVDASGAAAAQRAVLQRATQVRDKAGTALAVSSALPVRGLAQCFALPTALGWASFAQVTMAGVVNELARPVGAELIVELSQSVAESALGIDVFLPQALDVVTSVDAGAAQDCESIAAHLSGYSRFLVQAARSAQGYLGDVLGSPLRPGDTSLKDDYAAGALAAGEAAVGIDAAVASYAEETVQYTTALTYFWLTSYAVAAKEAYEVMPGIAQGDLRALRRGAMDAAVDETWWFVKTRTEALSAQGLDLGSAAWTARWALEESLANRGGPYGTDANWLALGELWYDAIQVTTFLSYVAPATIEPATS